MNFLEQIPKPILVLGAFLIGIAFLYVSNPPYTKCQTQIEILTKNLEGEIFAKQGKRLLFSPKLAKKIESCKTGNGPGGCFEMFASARKYMREVRNFDQECYEDLSQVAEVKGAMMQVMTLMVQVAWGEQPPDGPDKRFNWMEPTDLVLFCDLRDNFRRIYGEEEFLNFQNMVYTKLPGEPPQFEEGKCVNCSFRKGAVKLFPPQEIWRRSLFSTQCSAYR